MRQSVILISVNKKNLNVIREIRNMLINGRNKNYVAKMRPHIPRPKINYFEKVCQFLEIWYHYFHPLVKSKVTV